MNEKEKLIKEKRTTEATQKDLMGLGGKIGAIVEAMGTPIISQSGGLHEMGETLDWDTPDDKMPVFDEDEPITYLGMIFDGLKFGKHIEIKYFTDNKELNVYYKGYLVYQEIFGDLQCYTPFAEWEDLIDQTYKKADRIKKEKKNYLKEKTIIERKKEKVGFLGELRERWGI